MHDAQIRAIVPITVQIIVREPAAAGASPPPEHNRTANARLEPQPTPTPGLGPESISADARVGFAGGRRCAISGSELPAGRFASPNGRTTWQLHFDSPTDNAALDIAAVRSRRYCRLGRRRRRRRVRRAVVAAALMAAFLRLCSPRQDTDTVVALMSASRPQIRARVP